MWPRGIICAITWCWLASVANGSATTNPGNTLVRFQITTAGQVFGNVDVELFNQDKPETVRNFLLYVRSGAYSNGLLHRCVQAFALQGGGYGVLDPYSPSDFAQFTTVPSFGKVTNEFGVGPLLSNRFATLAMAKTGTNANSATSQWFFNLANNTNLDTQNGGFTVFGRVLETTNGFEGTNVLGFFKGLSLSNGIVNMTTFYGSRFSAFTDLPVSSYGYTKPTYFDLFSVQVTELNPPPPDLAPPKVRITSPQPDERVTNQTVTVTGTAKDNVGVARVLYRFQSNTPEAAAGTTNWSVSLPLRPGTNTVAVESMDEHGNLSPTALRSFFYVVKSPLKLQITGNGTVAGAVDGQSLTINKSYALTAHPGSNYQFAGWSGGLTSASPSLTFVMQTNLSLVARFILDPLLPGSFQGLFWESGSPTPESTGFLSISLGASREFSGSLGYNGGNYVFHNVFSPDGLASLSGNLNGVGVSLSLRLDLTDGTGQIEGSASGGNWYSTLSADRPWADSQVYPVPYASKYTFLMSGTASQAGAVSNVWGRGTAKVTKKGIVTVAGKLGDGTPFTGGTPLTLASRSLLSTPLYGGTGSIFGWLTFSTNQSNSLAGELAWFAPAGSVSPSWLTLSGSRYMAPTSGAPDARVLNWTNGVAVLKGGNLVTALTNRVVLTTSNTFLVVTGTEELELGIDPPTGLVQGSFLHPVTQLPVRLRGAVIQSRNRIGGYFPGINQMGSFEVSAE